MYWGCSDIDMWQSSRGFSWPLGSRNSSLDEYLLVSWLYSCFPLRTAEPFRLP